MREGKWVGGEVGWVKVGKSEWGRKVGRDRLFIRTDIDGALMVVGGYRNKYWYASKREGDGGAFVGRGEITELGVASKREMQEMYDAVTMSNFR